jgi:hypothetical protein
MMLAILTMNDGRKQAIPCKSVKETPDGWYEFDLGSHFDKSIKVSSVKHMEVSNAADGADPKEGKTSGTKESINS